MLAKITKLIITIAIASWGISSSTLQDCRVFSTSEVFGIDKCGKCGSGEIRYVTRMVDDYTFHEMHCTQCHARLAFGQNKKGGGLFPKRKENDKFLPNNGWTIYTPEAKK